MTSVLLPTPRRILIVGGGPRGLAALRNLGERGQIDEVVRAEYLEDPPKPDAPRTRPYWHHPFPEPESRIHPYPSLADTYAYLRHFAAPFLASGKIRLSTEVVWVDELPDARGWSVTTRDWRAGKDGAVRVEVWDAVVVATSWYDFPAWPEDTPRLAEALAAGLATHAQTWHGPVGYDGKRVVVVGNANSSNDIAAQLKPVAKTPVYRSIRRQGLRRFAFLPDPRVVDFPPIVRYIVKSPKKLDLELLDGSTLTDTDAVVLGTGYSAASAPFVRVLNSPSASATQSQTLTPLTSAHTSPPRIPGLHNYIVYAPTPTLSCPTRPSRSQTSRASSSRCSSRGASPSLPPSPRA
ncbi:hypothetical protein B0H13DRAFT_2682108 [Mycena leptocephala]|nr:hypothetical protein B0H13DRAFT_2682108 [Mycena leptocephala]